MQKKSYSTSRAGSLLINWLNLDLAIFYIYNTCYIMESYTKYDFKLFQKHFVTNFILTFKTLKCIMLPKCNYKKHFTSHQDKLWLKSYLKFVILSYFTNHKNLITTVKSVFKQFNFFIIFSSLQLCCSLTHIHKQFLRNKCVRKWYH